MPSATSYRCRYSRSLTTLHAQLAADLRSHRLGVFDDLLAEFGREIQGVAYLIVRNHADAEEIVLDTLVTAWKRSGSLRDPNALRPWLLRIATRHALSRRRRSIRAPWDHSTHLMSAEDPRFIDRIVLAEAMQRLPPKMRAAVVLHHYAGLTVPEVAAATGKSPNTIKSQLREAMARLRVALDVVPQGVEAR
ncbi:SigE family RNA polymerase sigma factor [soil metagenome]